MCIKMHNINSRPSLQATSYHHAFIPTAPFLCIFAFFFLRSSVFLVSAFRKFPPHTTLHILVCFLCAALANNWSIGMKPWNCYFVFNHSLYSWKVASYFWQHTLIIFGEGFLVALDEAGASTAFLLLSFCKSFVWSLVIWSLQNWRTCHNLKTTVPSHWRSKFCWGNCVYFLLVLLANVDFISFGFSTFSIETFA